MAKVINDGALVYKAADFDAPVLGHLRAGGTYQISVKTIGAFYQIKVRDNLFGYVSDVDVKPIGSDSGKKTAKAAHPKEKEDDELAPNDRKKKKAKKTALFHVFMDLVVKKALEEKK